MNPQPPADANDPRWLLSALADGEADAAEFGRGCAAWSAGDAKARESWHAYHLIGDVLRSEDLAAAPQRGRDFLARLSHRLDAEPAVLAPQPLQSAAPVRRRAWRMPAALAAGVMALATVLVVAIGPGSGSGNPAPTLAVAPAAPAVVAVAASAAPVVAEVAPPGGRVVRDAQLDRYLRAHRDYATALPGSLPGGSGRSIATVSLDR
jgi:sigma-E factor negative regulatory protein RseA